MSNLRNPEENKYWHTDVRLIDFDHTIIKTNKNIDEDSGASVGIRTLISLLKDIQNNCFLTSKSYADLFIFSTATENSLLKRTYSQPLITPTHHHSHHAYQW